MPVTVYLRDGAQVQADVVQRDGTAVRALVTEYETVVNDEAREAYRSPIGQVWKTWPAREVKAILARKFL